LEHLRRSQQPEELGSLGNPELWKGSATASRGHRPRGCAFKVQKHPNIWSVLAMSQSSTQKQTSLAQQGHRVFDMVRKFAKGAQEIEATLTSTTGEFLRFGNNELGQSQFTKSRTLSIRLASGKKQARTTTGRLDESFIQKAVEKAVDQLKTAPEDADYLQMLGRQKYPTLDRYNDRTVDESDEAKAGPVVNGISLSGKN